MEDIDFPFEFDFNEQNSKWFYGITYVRTLYDYDNNEPMLYYRYHICKESDVIDYLYILYKMDCKKKNKELQDTSSNEFADFLKENALLIKEYIKMYGKFIKKIPEY